MKRKCIYVLLVVCLMFVLISTVAYAGTAIPETEVDGLTIYSDSKGSWSHDTTNNIITCTMGGSSNSTLTIENRSNETMVVKFSYVTTLNKNFLGSQSKLDMTLPSNSLSLTQNVTDYVEIVETLGSTDSITIKLTSAAMTQGNTVTIKGLSATAASSKTTLTLKEVEKDENGNVRGSYTVQIGTGDVTTISDTAGAVEVSATDDIKLKATPVGDNKWYRWKIGNTYDYNQETAVTGISENTEIQAEFLPGSYHILYQVDGGWYFSWEDAMQAASSGSIVILMEDYTLPATKTEAESKGEKLGTYLKEKDGKLIYEVPSGVTFLIPYDSTNNTTDLLGQGVAESGKASSAGSAFRTLTIPKNVTVEVNGSFVVNAKRSSNTGPGLQGCTSGSYGKMILSGTMNINSGATLVSRGYIVDADHTNHSYDSGGTGRLYAYSGSTVKVLFQILNHRGGTATKDVISKVVPINNYTIANIMVRSEFGYGSTVVADYQVAYKLLSVSDKKGSVNVITSDPDADSLFVMESGSKVVMDYDYENDQSIMILSEGTINLSNIVLTINVGINIPIDTKNTQLPVADNFKVYIGNPDETSNSAVANVAYSAKMLPGAEIHVMKNATLNVPGNSSLFLYAYGTDDNKDYLDTWSNNRLRTRLNIQDVKNQNSRDIPDTDSRICIYEGGTVNLYGEFGQSGQSTDAIRIMEPNAQLIVSANALTAPTKEIYEAPLTDSSAVPVTNWTGVKGLLSGVSTSSADHKLFSTDGVGEGTYKSVEIDGVLYWYKHTVTYKIKGIGDAEKTVTQYICTDNTTFDPTVELNEGTSTQKYVITSTDKGVAGDSSPNKALTVDKGWESLVLTEITGDTVVNITVAPYQYRVQYSENANANSDPNPVEYINTNTYTSTWPQKPVYIKEESTFTDWDGNALAVDWDKQETESGTTFTATLTKDTKINLVVDTDVWMIKYSITGDYEYTDTAYVKKGENWTYTTPELVSSWLVIDQDSDAICGGTGTPAVSSNRRQYTVTNIGSNLEVTIKLTEYDHLLQFALTGGNDSESVRIDERYFNGTSTTVSFEDIEAKDGLKYTFQKADSVTCTGATASATKEVLTITGASGKTVAVNAMIEPYDAIVTIKQGNNEVLRDYYRQNETASYVFGDKLKIDGCTYTVDGVTKTYENGFTNPTLDENGNVENAKVWYVVGTKDVELNVTTSAFKHILTVNDGLGQVKTQYLSGTGYTYDCDPYYYITNATTTAGSVKSGIGGEKLEVVGINDNATVTITLAQFARRVEWFNSDTNAILDTTYLTNGQDSDTYTCINTAEQKQVAWVSQNPSSGTVTSQTGETITVTGIQANTPADDSNGTSEAVRIGLKLYDFDYKVTFTDGTNSDVRYVKNDKSVIENTDIIYSAKSGVYVTKYDLLDSFGNELSVKPTVAATGDNLEETATVMNGWRYLKLTNVTSDVTVKLTLAPYQYKVLWNIAVNVDGVKNESTELHYVDSNMDSCSIDSKYTITDLTTNNGTASYEGNVATVTGIDGNTTVNVVAQDYKYKITWRVDGEDVEQTTDEDTVVWTMPERNDGKTYVVVSADRVVGTGTITFTNKTVTVKPTSDMTVEIKTEEALTNYTALWGNMSFRYYKNAAYYGWDGEAYKWRLIEEYAWTHKSGSMIHTYADLEKVGEITSYTVPNGSVMIVNPTNQKIKATVTIQMDASTEYWKDTPVVTLTAADEAGTTGTTTITVYLDAHETLLISATLVGTPQDGLTDQATGSCSVKIDPID